MKRYLKGLLMALGMFTVIPMPKTYWDDESSRHIMKSYPVIGLVIGVLWSIIYKLLSYTNISMMVKAAFLMIFPFLITGMLHLDGFMDVCDALLSRRDKEEKIRILKDPSTGAFAVISLAIIFILNFSATYAFIEKEIIFHILLVIPVVSRSIIAIMLLLKPTMKESSFATYFKKGTGKLDIVILISFLLLATVASYILLSAKGLLLVILMIITAVLIVNNSCKELGGINGDIAGHGLVLIESIALLFLSII